MNTSPHWEFIVLRAKDQPKEKVLGVLFCYKNTGSIYVPSLIGIDYASNQTYAVYRQLLFESLQRANKLGFSVVDWGISANFEKRKLGAKLYSQKAYVKLATHFLMDELKPNGAKPNIRIYEKGQNKLYKNLNNK